MTNPAPRTPESGTQLGFEFLDLAKDGIWEADEAPTRATAEPGQPASDLGRAQKHRPRAIVRRWKPTITSGSTAATPAARSALWSGTTPRIPRGGRLTTRSPTAGSTGPPARSRRAHMAPSASRSPRRSWIGVCRSVRSRWPTSTWPTKRNPFDLPQTGTGHQAKGRVGCSRPEQKHPGHQGRGGGPPGLGGRGADRPPVRQFPGEGYPTG